MIRARPSIQLFERIAESLPRVPRDLFPLRLTAFEKFLIWDETPKQPLSSFIELHFLDPLQIQVMEDAIAVAVRIHPLLNCRVNRFDGELCWDYDGSHRHALRLHPEHSPLENGRPTAIDLFKEPGIRFWYREDKDGQSRVLLQLHHATSDGVGIRRFLIDVLNFYAQATAPGDFDPQSRTSWSKIDLGLLRQREDFSESFSGVPSQPLSLWQRLKNAWYFHFQLPRPLKGHSERDCKDVTAPLAATPDDDEPLAHLVMDREQSEAILEKARLEGVSVNALSLALLFETCSLWNEQHGSRRASERLRILMPYDLRSRVDLRMPATNRLSFAFLGRTRNQCSDTNELVRSIEAEVKSMKAMQLPMDFLNGLGGAVRYPRLMRWGLQHSRNMATAVLTYAGDISRGMQKTFPEQDGARLVGDARLDKILAAPPVRDNTHLALGLCINWGQLCISAAWNRDGLSRSECTCFLRLYQARWSAWLDSDGCVPAECPNCLVETSFGPKLRSSMRLFDDYCSARPQITSKMNPYEPPADQSCLHQPNSDAIRRPASGTALLVLWILEGSFKLWLIVVLVYQGMSFGHFIAEAYRENSLWWFVLGSLFISIETIGPWVGIYYLTGKRSRMIPFESALLRTLKVSTYIAVVATCFFLIYGYVYSAMNLPY